MTDPAFELDPRLQSDTVVVGELKLCRVLLMNDARYPWLILVPRLHNIRELFELSPTQQQQLMQESTLLSQAMAASFRADKMNIANLGNIVEQLHIHLIARFKSDPAWPGPVWGHSAAVHYTQSTHTKRLVEMQNLLLNIG